MRFEVWGCIYAISFMSFHVSLRLFVILALRDLVRVCVRVMRSRLSSYGWNGYVCWTLNLMIYLRFMLSLCIADSLEVVPLIFDVGGGRRGVCSDFLAWPP